MSFLNIGKNIYLRPTKKIRLILAIFLLVSGTVGRALRLTVKADWLTAINSDGLNRPFGPRIYFGVIFAH